MMTYFALGIGSFFMAAATAFAIWVPFRVARFRRYVAGLRCELRDAALRFGKLNDEAFLQADDGLATMSDVAGRLSLPFTIYTYLAAVEMSNDPEFVEYTREKLSDCEGFNEAIRAIKEQLCHRVFCYLVMETASGVALWGASRIFPRIIAVNTMAERAVTRSTREVVVEMHGCHHGAC